MGKTDAIIDSPEDQEKTDAQNVKEMADMGIVVEKEQPFLNYFWADAMWTIKLGVPLVVGNGSKMIQETFISIMLGRESTNLLAAVTTSVIWTGWADAMISSGVSQTATLISMAYGAGNFFLVGTWLQIGLVFLTLLYPPMALFRIVTGGVLEFFGVPVVVARLAGTFAIWSAPTVIFELYYMVVHTYFVCLGVTTPDAVISIVYIGVAVVFVYLGVYYFDAGAIGVALALSAKRVLRLITLVAYCTWMGYHKKTWGGWNISEITNRSRWEVFMPLAIPAMISGIASTISHSIGSIIAARLGAETAAAYDLMLCFFFLIQTGIGALAQGIGILMGRALGEGKPTRAIEVTKSGCAMTYGSLIVFTVLFYMFMPLYAELATYDPRVRKEVNDTRVVCSFCMLLCGGIALLSEVLVKQGRPEIVFTIIPLTTWFIGLPISFFAGPVLGINGIMWGNVIAYGLGHIFLIYYIYYSDWNQIAKDARIRSEVEEKAKSNPNLTEQPIEATQ